MKTQKLTRRVQHSTNLLLVSRSSHATQQPDSGRLRALVMPYSRELERTNLARVLHAHDALLPSHLVGDKSLVAWCAAPRLAAALIQYRYTSA